jgi:succinate-semialdehyde dehydrogenase / glutarate-semialdehyde dehydrogenase
MPTTVTLTLPGVNRRADVPTGLFVNGRWLDTEAKFPVVDPATGRTIAEVSDATEGDALRALDAAVTAQRGWADMAPRARADLMHALHAALTDRAPALADVMTMESGKPLAESTGEVALTLDFVRWFAEQAAHVHGSFARASRADFRIVTTTHPVGPTLLITPWNFPVLLPFRKAAAALAAGCAIVVKPAPETPLTCALLAEAIDAAGFPAGVFNLVPTSSSPEVCRRLMRDKRLRKVSFTGSTAVGAQIMQQAAPNILSVQLELGGNGPFIVLDDADIDLAVAQAIAGKFRNAGQACVAANRIVLHRGIADEFTDRFVKATGDLVVGPGYRASTTVGPMITSKQRDKTTRTVDEVTQSSAEVLAGGSPLDGEGYFYPPTVLQMKDAAPNFSALELFAPVAPLYTVDTVDQAIAFANQSEHGLSAYLFTRDISRAISLSERIEVGMVGVNRGVMADPAAPFGGMKASGVGREGGHDALAEFLEIQYIALTI